MTHYALAHPDKHFELHSATNAMLVAPPVADHSQRVYQIFGKDTLDQLIPAAAMQPLERIGLPQPPPWRRSENACGADISAREGLDDAALARQPDCGRVFAISGLGVRGLPCQPYLGRIPEVAPTH